MGDSPIFGQLAGRIISRKLFFPYPKRPRKLALHLHSVGHKGGEEQGQTGSATGQGVPVCGTSFEGSLRKPVNALLKSSRISVGLSRAGSPVMPRSGQGNQEIAPALDRLDRAVNSVLNQPSRTLITFCTQRGKSSRSS